MGRNGPNVEWIGLIVRTDDGQVHAVEMNGRGGRVTADLVINPHGHRGDGEFPITAIINGVGKYWQEGATMGPDVQPRRELSPETMKAINSRNLIVDPALFEGGEGDGARG